MKTDLTYEFVVPLETDAEIDDAQNEYVNAVLNLLETEIKELVKERLQKVYGVTFKVRW